MSVEEIKKCRVCGNQNLVSILDLGEQCLTGIFPRPGEYVPRSPVELVKCHGEKDCCGLVQLKHTYDLLQMYGDDYGYRSGLNKSMIAHLRDFVTYCQSLVVLAEGDLVLDIGSNDGTLLGHYVSDMEEFNSSLCPRVPRITLVGIDPTIKKFANYYLSSIIKIPDFFSAEKFFEDRKDTNRRAKIVTSVSCFYDLEDPCSFAKDVSRVLHPEGVWVFEQSYSLLMLAKNMYDTCVAEHLEYYSLAQVRDILSQADLVIEEVTLNNCNGGSFRVVARHKDYLGDRPLHPSVKTITDLEEVMGLGDLSVYHNFQAASSNHKKKLRKFLLDLNKSGKKVYGLGASTKFNAVLQYCNIGPDLITKIGEVNEDKFGRVTPGTGIPIVSEDEVLIEKPDFLVVGPYHFRDFLIGLSSIKSYLKSGGALVFPLPTIEIVRESDL